MSATIPTKPRAAINEEESDVSLLPINGSAECAKRARRKQSMDGTPKIDQMNTIKKSVRICSTPRRTETIPDPITPISKNTTALKYRNFFLLILDMGYKYLSQISPHKESKKRMLTDESKNISAVNLSKLVRLSQ